MMTCRLTSSASFDPVFWPLHGQIERILGLKRIQLSRGVIKSSSFDETWGFYDDTTTYLAGSCDWSGVTSSEDLTLPVCSTDSE